ncbi:MAG: transcriptional regulator [Promethearchaeota archaeon]|jgi:DNA-binding MarR family transcriptional regulator
MSTNQILDEIIKGTERINSKACTLNRSLILALCYYFIDGIQFRELKTALNISDGNLSSNLRALTKVDYLKENETVMDKKKIKYFSITKNGKKELEKIINWIELIKKLLEEDKNETEL